MNLSTYGSLRIATLLFFAAFTSRAHAFDFPKQHCGDIVDIALNDVDPRIVEAVRKRSGFANAEYTVRRQHCDDGEVIFFEAMGKYHNPGFHWLVLVSPKKTFEIVSGA